jgi:peptidoglycan/xylan/chitin deacetylase (PgdA/CDA1 family)
MRLRELSIIQYQNISPRPHPSPLWLSLESFEKQLEYISMNDFQVLSMDDALKYMVREGSTIRSRPISLTFDNGYLDFYDKAFPILSKHHVPATLLISPLKVGKHREIGDQKIPYLTWDIVRELADKGIEIGAYEDDAWSLNNLPEERVLQHVTEYKKELEDQLGKGVHYFGVKEGIPSEKIRDLLISEGYRAFLTECPTNQKADLYAIGRIQVDDDDFNIFLTKISKTYLFFKDKRSWKYIREYSLDKLAHRLSEGFDRMRGIKVQ